MKKKTTAFVASLLTILSLAICGCGSDDENAVKIAYLPITHSLATLQTAEQLGKEQGVKIKLVKFGSWTELLDALNSNKVDGASVLIELAMKSKQQGVGIKAAALGHRDGNVVVVSNGVDSIEDLRGKSFAIPHRQSSHYILLNDALATAGLSVEDVNVTELAPTEMPSALASGQIDGYCVAEPFGAMSVALGTGKVLFQSEELWEDSLCCALVLTDKFIDERTDEARQFVDAYKKAGASLDKEAALDVAKKYLNQPEDVLKASLQWISYDDLDITEDAYDQLLKKVKSYGLSDNPPAYEDFIKNDF